MASAGVFQPSTRLAFLSTRLAGNALPRLLPVLKVSHGCPGNGRKHSPLRHMGLDTVGLVAAAIATLVHRIRHRKRFLPWLSMVALTIAATAFLGTAGWALNHYAPELSRDLGLEVAQHSEGQLASVTAYYLGQAASRASLVPREEDGTPPTGLLRTRKHCRSVVYPARPAL